jgi:hypothetical protein
MARPLTIGFISTWPVYQGTTIDRYAHSLLQGISAAAQAFETHLLLGCGFSVPGNGWDPARPSSGNNWENQALFDFDNRALPAMGLFGKP